MSCRAVRVVFTVMCALTAFTAAHAQLPSGAVLWLRGDAGITAAGDSVLRWDDQSGIGNSMVQNTPANRPRVIPCTLNSLPVVRFDGATSYLEGPPMFPTARDYTLSLVVKILNFGATNNIVSGNSHAHWLGGARYPRVLHGNFNTQEVSS